MFRGSASFAVSFGRSVCIYNTAGEKLADLFHATTIDIIQPYQGGYFLLALDRYFYYQDTNVLVSEFFAAPFDKLRGIFVQDELLLILHNAGYTFAKISKMHIYFNMTLTDSAFYSIRSIVQTPSDIHILASFHSRLCIITYRKGSLGKKYARREIEQGEYMLAVGSSVLLLSGGKLFHWSDRTTQVMEFGNDDISHSLSLPDKAIVFCKNGEVYEIRGTSEGGFTSNLLITLDETITCAAEIGTFLFCGSSGNSYLLDSANITKAWRGCGRPTDIKYTNGLEYMSSREAIQLGRVFPNDMVCGNGANSYVNYTCQSEDPNKADGAKGIKVNTLTTESTASHEPAYEEYNPIRIFKKDGLYAIIYPHIGVLNGLLVPHLYSCYAYSDAIAFSTKSIFFILSSKILSVNIEIECVKYLEELAIFHDGETLWSVDICTRLAACRHAPYQVSDILVNREFVFLLLFDGSFVKIGMDEMLPGELNFENHDSLAECLGQAQPPSQALSINKSILDFLEEDGDISSNSSVVYGSIKGTIYKLVNNEVIIAMKIDGYIGQIVDVAEGLMLTCSDGLLLCDPAHNRTARANKATLCFFVKNNTPYVCNKEGIYRSTLTFSTFTSWHRHTSLNPGQKLLYSDCRHAVSISYSPDMRNLRIGGVGSSELRFEETAAIDWAVLQPGYFCISIANISTKSSKLALFQIRKRRIVLRDVVETGEIPLYLSAIDNNLAVITQSCTFLYSLKANRLVKKRAVATESNFCKNVYFLNRTSLALVGDDYTYKIIDFKREKAKERCHNRMVQPFIFKKRLCSFSGRMIRLHGITIDCGEQIVAVHPHHTELFVFGCTGAVYLVREPTLSPEEHSRVRKLQIPSIFGRGHCIDLDVLRRMPYSDDTSDLLKRLETG